MAAAKKATAPVEMRPLEIQYLNIRIVGETPLIVHAMSTKSKRMMLEAQQGKNKTKKKRRKKTVP